MSLSILLSATTIGTSAARAWLIASIVCGITPSSAATISTTMSVTWAPRARIFENAAWPGVSMNVISCPSVIDLVRTDVLGDAAGLAGHDVGVADLVEQRGLAVVDVAHDGDDRRAGRLQLLVLVVAVVEQRLQLHLLLLAGVDQQQVGADLEREQLHLLVGQGHRGGDHLAVVEQEADDVGGGAVQLGRELLGRHAALDDDRALGDGASLRRVVARDLRLQLVEVATATAALALARGAALPAGTRTAAGTARASGPPGPPGPPGRGRVAAAGTCAAGTAGAGAAGRAGARGEAAAGTGAGGAAVGRGPPGDGLRGEKLLPPGRGRRARRDGRCRAAAGSGGRTRDTGRPAAPGGGGIGRPVGDWSAAGRAAG